MQVMLGLNNVITTFQTGINCCYLLSPDIGKNYLDIQLVATLLHFHGFITSPLIIKKESKRVISLDQPWPSLMFFF